MTRATTLRILASALAFTVTTAAPALGIDLDDPNLFGPGEGWTRPVTLAVGDGGPWVARLQRRLAARGYRPGRVDGIFGAATLGAVHAFQKLHGLERDGEFGDEDWAALDTARRASLPTSERHPDRVEVDLERQVLFLVSDNRVEAVLPVSSGNGELFRGRTGRLVPARTPEGSHTFRRHIDGWRISYLGALYRPFYYLGGYAIHGSTSVPPYPASHGCIRVTIPDMDYLATRLEIGMPVYVYGVDATRSELLGG